MNLHGSCRGRIVLAVLAALALATAPASAAILLNVRADIAAGRDARASLTFDSGVPSYKIYGNGSSDVSLVLLGTSRAANAAASIVGKDSLKSITIDQLGDSIAVTFHTASSANVSVTNGNGQSLLASLHASRADAGTDNFGGSPLSAPTAAPAPASAAGTLMEVVPLKYADVGEIVGLLVAGQQIPSNDTFAPQAQSFGAGYGGAAGFGSASIGAPLTAQSGSQPVTALAGTGTLGQQINENIGIDRRLNAIVLSGTPDVIGGYKAKIAQIDIPLPSTGYQQGYPTLSQREATTTATVKDGEPFVIGGLLQNDELRSLAKVPGIGDLPLIGWLFRVRHDQSKTTNLYIIVTPHILTNGNPVPPGVPGH